MMIMNLYEAWRCLGKDPESLYKKLSGLPREARVDAAIEALEEAKKISKKLMAVHHPDRGGDPESFRMIGEALSIIESNTNEFKSKMLDFLNQAKEKQNERIIIVRNG